MHCKDPGSGLAGYHEMRERFLRTCRFKNKIKNIVGTKEI